MAVEWKRLEKLKYEETLAEDLYDPLSLKILLPKGTKMTKAQVNVIKDNGIFWIPLEVHKDDLRPTRRLFDEAETDLTARGFDTAIQVEIYRDFIGTFENILKDLNAKKPALSVFYQIVNILIDEVSSNQTFVINFFRRYQNGYPYKHGINTAILSLMVGVALSMSRQNLFLLAQSAILHDIGYVFTDTPDYVDIGKLPEREKVIQHISKLREILYSSNFIDNPEVLVAILDHHEKYDGSGVPLGKAKDEISLYAKIIQIADAYDSLISTTSEALKMSPYQAIKWIIARTGKDYDPQIMNNFLRVTGIYPTGTRVKLSNGKSGIVLRSSKSGLLIPVVVVDDNLIDLSKDKNIWIETVIY